jgi:hypothetical protein
MKFASIFFGYIALVAPVGQAQEFPKFDPLWSKCKKDSDCVHIRGTCEDQFVNKKSEQDAQTFHRWNRATVQCKHEYLEKAVKPKVSCVKETCVAK